MNLLALALGLSIQTSTVASKPAIQSVFDPETHKGVFSWTLGFSFRANKAMRVVSLGAFDEGADGLKEDHLVGLFQVADDGTTKLIAQATVVSESELDGQFRYAKIRPVRLKAGPTYVIGATWMAQADPYMEEWSSLETDPQIEFLESRRTPIDAPRLRYPEQHPDVEQGFVGPSFQWEPDPGPLPVVLSLPKLWGKPVSAYQAVLGKPQIRKGAKPKAPATYILPAKNGVIIELVSLPNGKPTSLSVTFPIGANPSFEEGFAALGVQPIPGTPAKFPLGDGRATAIYRPETPKAGAKLTVKRG